MYMFVYDDARCMKVLYYGADLSSCRQEGRALQSMQQAAGTAAAAHALPTWRVCTPQAAAWCSLARVLLDDAPRCRLHCGMAAWLHQAGRHA